MNHTIIIFLFSCPQNSVHPLHMAYLQHELEVLVRDLGARLAAASQSTPRSAVLRFPPPRWRVCAPSGREHWQNVSAGFIKCEGQTAKEHALMTGFPRPRSACSRITYKETADELCQLRSNLCVFAPCEYWIVSNTKHTSILFYLLAFISGFSDEPQRRGGKRF